MLNYIWAFMIIISFVCAIVNGKIENLSSSILEGALESVNIIILSLGSMAFWSGIMEIAWNSGLTKRISKLLYPILKFLFSEYSNEERVLQPICMNIISNMLGLGNAATPFGLKAINEMQKTNKFKDTANDSMIMLLVVNTACLQIIPTFLAVLRKNHGSLNPFDMLLPLWMTSFCALGFGITINKIISYKHKTLKNNIPYLKTKYKINNFLYH